MPGRNAFVLSALAFVLVPVSPLAAESPKYLEDFEFIRTTVERDSADLKAKRIDWPAECARLRPLFARCTGDVEHVKNVMRLLAVLRDSHTGVTETSFGWNGLPSKWDGLYGGGLWIGWDRGWLVVMGIMKGHPLGTSVPLGSVIAAIDGMPAWLALERERRRITEFAGTSTDHSLFASMDNRLLPFGDKFQVDLLVLTPEGKSRHVTVPRWGPGGKAFYPSEATLPDGVAWGEGAVAKLLETTWCRKLGYVRITGNMDAATVSAFHAAFESLKGMEACLLDCRSMGGGGDDMAWEMAGRFFPRGVDNGTYGLLKPSGSWQFGGPVVMLQDEKEVSSAETFTWAMSETGRAISVGQTTGGWGIIPGGYSCPSGIVSFRLGVNDRPTPIRKIHTEGAGWPPDVPVPYGPVVRARADPVREIGMEVLRVLRAGANVGKTRELFAGLAGGRIADFAKGAGGLADAKGFDPKALAALFEEDLRRRLAAEAALLRLDEAGPPDALGARARLAVLEPRATAAGLKGALGDLQAAVKKLAAEAEAQEAFLAITDRALGASDRDREKFLSAHKGTLIARFAKERLWK